MHQPENRMDNAILDRKILYPGNGAFPHYDNLSKVTFHFKTSFIQNDDEVIIDESKKLNKPMFLIIGKFFRLSIWEELIKTMCVNEISRFVINKNLLSCYPYISAGYRKYANYPIPCKLNQNSSCGGRILENGVGYDDLNELIANPRNLIFIFEIIDVHGPNDYNKEVWLMNDEEKKNEILNLKQIGNDYYKNANYLEAEKCYLKAINILESLLVKYVPKSDEFNHLKIIYKAPLMLNMAQLTFKQEKYYESIKYCNKVLKIDDQNVKAYFRRACSQLKVWNKFDAEKDFDILINLDPKMNKVVSKELKEFDMNVKKYEEEEKNKLVKKLLDKKENIIRNLK